VLVTNLKARRSCSCLKIQELRGEERPHNRGSGENARLLDGCARDGREDDSFL